MAITAAEVNKLRQVTGAGMMDCKKALEEANGDFEAAIDNLRKKGQKVSAKRADREANEGVVVALTSNEGNKGIVVKISSETDFVAKNEEFIAFSHKIADVALANFPATIEDLKALPFEGDTTIGQKIDEQVAKIGEKIDVIEYAKSEAPGVVAYNHAGNKIGVLVSLNSDLNDAITSTAKDVAMQIAAMSPLALDKDGVDTETIERELEVAKDQVRAEGKPENMIEKIAMGKLEKFYKETTLLNQQFVKDNSKSVKQILEDTQKGLTVTAFSRIALG
jgi:elongation factor Ts